MPELPGGIEVCSRRRSFGAVITALLAAVGRRGSFQRFWRDERGATMVEYGLILMLIASVCVAAAAALGQGALTLFQTVPAGL